MNTKEAAKLLGITDQDTIKNWLQGGYFPWAKCFMISWPSGDSDYYWHFDKDEVLKVKARMDKLNITDVLDLPTDENYPEPPKF